MVCHRGLRLTAAVGAATVVFARAAGADPGSPSYEQGRQAIDEQVNHFHVQLNPSIDLNRYCQGVLMGDLKRGKFARVDSAPDFIAGCRDEGRTLLASQ
jgi:hypothetical protein